MVKKFFSALILTCLLIFGGNNAYAADNFQVIYNAEQFTETLKSDEAVDETFNTNDGKFRIQLRKLKNSSSDKRMHVLAWLNDKRIYDEHFPDVYAGYTFRAIKNTADSRQFYVIQSRERAIMIGYSPVNSKIEVYIDSQNYQHKYYDFPTIVATTNGNLILAFENSSGTSSSRFRFTWDASKQWFAYSDLGNYGYTIEKDRQK